MGSFLIKIFIFSAISLRLCVYLFCISCLFATLVGCGKPNRAGDSFAARYDRALAEENAESRAGLLLRLATAQHRAKDDDGAERSLAAAASAAGKVTDPAGRASLFRRVARLQARTDHRSAATNAVRKAHRAIQNIEQAEQRATALCEIADVEGYWLKQTAAAHKSLDEALNLAKDLDDAGGKVLVLASAGSAYARMGDAADAGRVIAEALELVEQIDDPAGQSGALVRVARAQLRMSNKPAAVDSLQRARKAAEAITSEHRQVLKLTDVAAQLARAGEAAEAREVLTTAERVAEQIKDTALRRQALQRVLRVRKNM